MVNLGIVLDVKMANFRYCLLLLLMIIRLLQVMLLQAGHNISIPYLPTTINHNGLIPFGGECKKDAEASIDSWKQVKLFLRENLNKLT